ncbi:hypothetical protein B484DRAFT_471248, partial [Ochromonadaceae sp. CCMP2298]
MLVKAYAVIGVVIPSLSKNSAKAEQDRDKGREAPNATMLLASVGTCWLKVDRGGWPCHNQLRSTIMRKFDVVQITARNGSRHAGRQHPEMEALDFWSRLLLTPEWKRFKSTIENFAEGGCYVGLMSVLTVWVLFSSDLQLAFAPAEADPYFEGVLSFAFFMFLLEIALQCIYKEDYCHLTWLLGDSGDVIMGQHAKAGNASRAGARAGRIVRLLRMVRLVRMVNLVKLLEYATKKTSSEAVTPTYRSQRSRSRARSGRTPRTRSGSNSTVSRSPSPSRGGGRSMYSQSQYSRRGSGGRDSKYSKYSTYIASTESEVSESRIGSAMSDLINRRVLVLILLMLLIIPLLVVEDPDTSQYLGVRFVHHLALLNQTAPALYTDGLALALRTVVEELPVLAVVIGDQYVYDGRVARRASEMTVLAMHSGGLLTEMVFDAKERAAEEAADSMYSTCTILVLRV